MDDWAEPLGELRHHWGSAYAISHPGPDAWVAQRRDDHATLRSDSPVGLLDLIRADYGKRPVPRQVPGADQPSAPSCRLLPG